MFSFILILLNYIEVCILCHVFIKYYRINWANPIVKLNNLVQKELLRCISRKLKLNPGSSVKDRIAQHDWGAERDGLIKPGDTIDWSNQQSLVLAFHGLEQPATKFSILRQKPWYETDAKVIQAYGAELVLTQEQQKEWKGCAKKHKKSHKSRKWLAAGCWLNQRFWTDNRAEVIAAFGETGLDALLAVSELAEFRCISRSQKSNRTSKPMQLKQTDLLSFLVRSQVLWNQDFQLDSFQRFECNGLQRYCRMWSSTGIRTLEVRKAAVGISSAAAIFRSYWSSKQTRSWQESPYSGTC